MEISIYTVLISFLAGLASFLSPCVLPLVPGYISLISGVSIDQLKGGDGSRTTARRAIIINSLAFNAGLSLIFVTLGTTAGLVGAALFTNPWVRIIGGLAIILFGLHMIGLLKIGALYRDTRSFSNERPRGMLGSLTLGMAFAAGWTPCIGPWLGAIIGLAATSGGWKGGLLLSSFYAAGLAVPFLLTGLGINQFLGFYARFRQHLHKVEVVSGVILIIIGALVASGYVTRLASSSLITVLPNAEAWVQKLAAGNEPAPAASAGVPPQQNRTFASAPDVEFQTLDAQPFRLGEQRGRVVLLNFWATWCVPCREEIPALNEMQRDLGERGLEVVGVSWDDTAEGVREYQQDVQKIDYRIVLGGEGAQMAFGSSVLPTSFIIDREGRIREKIIGARSRAGFEALIKPLLDEAEAAANLK